MALIILLRRFKGLIKKFFLKISGFISISQLLTRNKQRNRAKQLNELGATDLILLLLKSSWFRLVKPLRVSSSTQVKLLAFISSQFKALKFSKTREDSLMLTELKPKESRTSGLLHFFKKSRLVRRFEAISKVPSLWNCCNCCR